MTAPVTIRNREARSEVVALLEALRRDVDLAARWASRAPPGDAVRALAALRHLAADLTLALDEFRLLCAADPG